MNRNHKYAFIFDLDGVLVDTSKHHYLAWKTISKRFDFNLTESFNEQLKGVSRMDSLDLILGEAQVKLSIVEQQELANQKNEIYLSLISKLNKSDVLPGVMDFLSEAKKLNISMAVGSSSKNAHHIISKTGILSYFSVIVDGNMVSNTKPDPEVFLLAAKKLNHPAEFCIVFEDSIKGIEAGLKANMIVVGIGSVEKLNHAHLVFNGINDFTVMELLNRVTTLQN